MQLAGFSYNFWAEFLSLTQSVRWGYVNNYSTTLLLMDFLLPSFWHASRTSIYLWLLCQPHKYTAKEIWSDRKRSSESSKFMTNLRKVRSSLETSINSSIFALSRDMFLLQFDEAILREMNGANTHITWMQLRSIYYDCYYWSEIIVCEDGNSHREGYLMS